MKTFYRFLLAALVSGSSLASLSAYASSPNQSASSTEKKNQALTKKLKSLLGEHATFNVEKYNDLLYLVTTNGQLFFTTADGRYVFLDKVIDTSLRVDLVEQVRKTQRKAMITTIPREKLLTYPATNEKNIITVFTDIDCPFCRKLHKEISTLNQQGVSVDYVMIPRGAKDSKAFTKTANVLCAGNAQQAMDSAMHSGSYTLSDKATPQCNNSLVAQQQLAQQFNFMHTPTILLPSGEALPGYASTSDIIERLAATSK